MDRLFMTLVLSIAMAGLATTSTTSADDGKAAYYATADQAAADYRDAHAQCETLDGNAQTVCIEEAKLTQTQVKANAEAKYRNTPEARQKARTDIANAAYAVAKAKCESREEDERHACIRQAYALKLAMAVNAEGDEQ